VQVGQESGHLLVRESAGEGGHGSLPREHNLPYYSIRGRSAAEEGVAVEDVVQIGRDFPERLVVVLVAMSAPDLIKALAFRLLRGKRGL
jgi:hypothetical protein